jgi:hypothetical protein
LQDGILDGSLNFSQIGSPTIGDEIEKDEKVEVIPSKFAFIVEEEDEEDEYSPVEQDADVPPAFGIKEGQEGENEVEYLDDYKPQKHISPPREYEEDSEPEMIEVDLGL